MQAYWFRQFCCYELPIFLSSANKLFICSLVMCSHQMQGQALPKDASLKMLFQFRFHYAEVAALAVRWQLLDCDCESRFHYAGFGLQHCVDGEAFVIFANFNHRFRYLNTCPKGTQSG